MHDGSLSGWGPHSRMIEMCIYSLLLSVLCKGLFTYLKVRRGGAERERERKILDLSSAGSLYK